MAEKTDNLNTRKREHLELCYTDSVSFRTKSAGFEHYDFIHYAMTEARPADIDLTTAFFGKKIGLPFLISCMTGGTGSAENINLQLAEAATELNIPLGLGSLRYALHSTDHYEQLRSIRRKAGAVPVLGNIGAAQIIQEQKDFSCFQRLIEVIEADAFVVHLNPLQEMLQRNGEPDFTGLRKVLTKFIQQCSVPVIVKEVGSGISKAAAKKLLKFGAKGIDTAGAGGTSWAGVEILRNGNYDGDEFWDWGLPTSYCIRTVNELKEKYDFILIGSGGVNSAMDAAKALALGADITASARIILQELDLTGCKGVVDLITSWFETIRAVMYLTGSRSLAELRDNKLQRKEEFI